MEGEASKVQSEPPPQYSQPPPQYNQPQPPYGQPIQYDQPPAVAQSFPMGYPQPVMQQQQHQQSTVVVVNQPAPAPAFKPPRLWSTGIFGCCEDMAVCCCVTFCPCCAESGLAMDMGESRCLPCCVPGWLIVLRTKLRTQHNIQGSVMDDCCAIRWCYWCVLCQMMREVKLTRGMEAVAY